MSDKVGAGSLERDAIVEAWEALSVTMHGCAEVVAAIELLDRQRMLMEEVGNALHPHALLRLDRARELLGDLRRRIQGMVP